MNLNLKSAWRKDKTSNSLAEVYSSVKIPKNAGFWRKYLAFAGPGPFRAENQLYALGIL